MPGASHAVAPAYVHRLVLHAQCPRGAGQRDAAIGAQDGVRRQQRLERRLHTHRHVRLQDEVGRCSGSVSRHQHRGVLRTLAASQRLTAAPARTAQQPSVSLAGGQEVGLIGLGDAHKLACLHALGAGKKAVAPPKGRALRHAQTLGDLVEREPFAQGLCLAHPLVSQMQPRKRCTCQCIERACALAALEALQPVG